MKEDMFDVLMYLFEHYYMDEDTVPINCSCTGIF